MVENAKNMEKLRRLIKNNRFVRGFYMLVRMSFGVSRHKFGRCADGVILTPPIFIGNAKNVFLYDRCNLASYSWISATNARFICKGHCAIAEGLTVHTGNHARIVGQFVSDINELNKPKGYDEDVIVEEDVWIGCNVTLLSGVTIGRGATVAAGAVVSKSMPPYCICGGVPAKFIKFYWTIDQILEHEAKLYPEAERYSREQLEEIFEKYK